MQDNSNMPTEPGGDSKEKKPLTNPEEDGRNKEWQDRSRVNLEQVPEGTQTNIERDFEPENIEEKEKNNNKKDETPY